MTNSKAAEEFAGKYMDKTTKMIAIGSFLAGESYQFSLNENAVRALRELVELKDIKDRFDELYPFGNKNHPTVIEYNKRKPLAWEQARKVIAGESVIKGEEWIAAQKENNLLRRIIKVLHQSLLDAPVEFPNSDGYKASQEEVKWRSIWETAVEVVPIPPSNKEVK